MTSPTLSVAARKTIDAAPSDIFDLLRDLDRHDELTDPGIRILRLHGPPGRRTGGLVQLRGPAGVTRLARTRVQGAEPRSRLWGAAETRTGPARCSNGRSARKATTRR